jgi:hypothetical protein
MTLDLAPEPAVATLACIAICAAGVQFAPLFHTTVPIGTIFGFDHKLMP